MKKKLIMGIASAALGVSLLGGTWAEWQDVETFADNDAKMGTMNLKPELEKTVLFEITDLAPGDTMTRSLPVSNSGNVKIKDVMFNLDTLAIIEGTETGLTSNLAADNGDDLYDTIKVKAFKNGGAGGTAIKAADGSDIEGLSLKQLAALPAFDISNDGLNPNSSEIETLYIQLEVENRVGVDQNHLQGDHGQFSIDLIATQRDGMERTPNQDDATPDVDEPGDATGEQ